jgi:hypothetical protein
LKGECAAEGSDTMLPRPMSTSLGLYANVGANDQSSHDGIQDSQGAANQVERQLFKPSHHVARSELMTRTVVRLIKTTPKVARTSQSVLMA